jgi:hypothetical protein
MLQKEFGVLLEYTNLGYLSVTQMASSLPDVFRCVQVDRGDCKLFDARKKIPSEYAKHNMKYNIHGKLYLQYKKFIVAEYFMCLPEL